MKFKNKDAELFILDGKDEMTAISSTNIMVIAAHPDDIEMMAFHAVAECYDTDKNLLAVVITDGAGSIRNGEYANFTDEQMRILRKSEQKEAAIIGKYAALAMLNYTSAQLKERSNNSVACTLSELIEQASPEIIYTHNPADSHETHVAAVINVISAIRRLPKSKRPINLFGCEVWRSLDWMQSEDKVLFDASGYPELSASLVKVFGSQINDNRRYDEATLARRLANAVFLSAHEEKEHNSIIFGMDLTPLIEDNNLNVSDFTAKYIDRFKADVVGKIKKFEHD